MFHQFLCRRSLLHLSEMPSSKGRLLSSLLWQEIWQSTGPAIDYKKFWSHLPLSYVPTQCVCWVQMLIWAGLGSLTISGVNYKVLGHKYWYILCETGDQQELDDGKKGEKFHYILPEKMLKWAAKLAIGKLLPCCRKCTVPPGSFTNSSPMVLV